MRAMLSLTSRIITAGLAIPLSWFISSAPASAAPSLWQQVEKNINSQNKAALQEDLRVELKSRLKTFHRPVKVYHYGNRGPLRYSELSGSVQTTHLKINHHEAMDLARSRGKGPGLYSGPVELSPPEAAKYFRAMTQNFRTEEPDWNVGQGLYAAIDPVQSEIYMGNPWFLLEISVPAGLRYLDIRPGDGIAVSEAFIRKWVVPESGRSYDRFEGKQLPNHLRGLEMKYLLELPKLAQMVFSLFDELKVDALAYPWQPHTSSFCANISGDGQIAFDFIDPRSLSRGIELKVFVQTLEAKANETKRAEYARVLDLIESSRLSMNAMVDSQGKMEWMSNLAPSRVLTLGWVKALGRKSILSTFFPDQQSIASLEAFFIQHQAGGYPLKLSYDPHYSLDPTAANAELKLEPLELLEKIDSPAYEKRKALLESTIFGCNAKFVEENRHPRY